MERPHRAAQSVRIASFLSLLLSRLQQLAEDVKSGLPRSEGSNLLPGVFENQENSQTARSVLFSGKRGRLDNAWRMEKPREPGGKKQ
jgi:hypothetical protein